MSGGETLLVLSTIDSAESAGQLGRQLVERRLAACVNVVGPIRSIYRWNEKVDDDSEYLLLMKTTRARFDELRQALLAEHPYDEPELIGVPIADGSAGYLAWVAASTSAEGLR